MACGHKAAARELMAAGADVDRMDPTDRYLPVHAAARGGMRY